MGSKQSVRRGFDGKASPSKLSPCRFTAGSKTLRLPLDAKEALQISFSWSFSFFFFSPSSAHSNYRNLVSYYNVLIWLAVNIISSDWWVYVAFLIHLCGFNAK